MALTLPPFLLLYFHVFAGRGNKALFSEMLPMLVTAGMALDLNTGPKPSFCCFGVWQ
jgi:hypothetical protein